MPGLPWQCCEIPGMTMRKWGWVLCQHPALRAGTVSAGGVKSLSRTNDTHTWPREQQVPSIPTSLLELSIPSLKLTWGNLSQRPTWGIKGLRLWQLWLVYAVLLLPHCCAWERAGDSHGWEWLGHWCCTGAPLSPLKQSIPCSP